MNAKYVQTFGVESCELTRTRVHARGHGIRTHAHTHADMLACGHARTRSHPRTRAHAPTHATCTRTHTRTQAAPGQGLGPASPLAWLRSLTAVPARQCGCSEPQRWDWIQWSQRERRRREPCTHLSAATAPQSRLCLRVQLPPHSVRLPLLCRSCQTFPTGLASTSSPAPTWSA